MITTLVIILYFLPTSVLLLIKDKPTENDKGIVRSFRQITDDIEIFMPDVLMYVCIFTPIINVYVCYHVLGGLINYRIK